MPTPQVSGTRPGPARSYARHAYPVLLCDHCDHPVLWREAQQLLAGLWAALQCGVVGSMQYSPVLINLCSLYPCAPPGLRASRQRSRRGIARGLSCPCE